MLAHPRPLFAFLRPLLDLLHPSARSQRLLAPPRLLLLPHLYSGYLRTLVAVLHLVGKRARAADGAIAAANGSM